MRGVRKGFELILMTIFAGVSSDVIVSTIGRWFGFADSTGLRALEALPEATQITAATSSAQISRDFMILF
jgi:hypothetical protein